MADLIDAEREPVGDMLDAYKAWLKQRGPLGTGAMPERIFFAGWLAARRTPSASIGEDGLPPIEYDKSIDRTYIPLPGGWEIQTKGNGSTFRIAHVGSRQRWQVLDEVLHEPLEGLAREMRNHFADLRAQLARQSQGVPVYQAKSKLFPHAWHDIGANLMEPNERDGFETRVLYAAPPLSSEQQAEKGERE